MQLKELWAHLEAWEEEEEVVVMGDLHRVLELAASEMNRIQQGIHIQQVEAHHIQAVIRIQPHKHLLKPSTLNQLKVQTTNRSLLSFIFTKLSSHKAGAAAAASLSHSHNLAVKLSQASKVSQTTKRLNSLSVDTPIM